MRPNAKRTTAAVALTACLCLTGMFAAYTSELGFVNDFAVDTVDIELESSIAEDAPRLTNGTGRPALIDDSEVEHNLTISNEGANCYIRCKSLYSRASVETPDSLDTFDATGNIAADPNLWHLAEDGYLYYKGVLGEGEAVSLVEMVSNAPEWRKVVVDGEQVLAGFDMTASFMVEAVQSRNFTPDFASATPWGDVEPEVCIYSRSGLEGA